MQSKILKNDFRKLEQMVKSLDEKHSVKIGIFGNKASRSDKGAQNNPTIGALHEFGSVTKGIPARSWLEMPLHRRADNIIKATQIADMNLLGEGKIIEWFKRIGIRCENAIQQAFDSRGFGTWKKNAPSTIARKGSDAPLIDTAQLRRSVASKAE